jgi:hypothetical protein
MNIPVSVLLGLAAWTLLTLFGSIGVYRWGLILMGRASLAEWRAELPQGSDWYQRAMRASAHKLRGESAGLCGNRRGDDGERPAKPLDRLAVTMLAARIGQTLTHVALPQTNTASILALFFMQADLSAKSTATRDS